MMSSALWVTCLLGVSWQDRHCLLCLQLLVFSSTSALQHFSISVLVIIHPVNAD